MKNLGKLRGFFTFVRKSLDKLKNKYLQCRLNHWRINIAQESAVKKYAIGAAIGFAVIALYNVIKAKFGYLP